MATRTLSRRALREQHDQAETNEQETAEPAGSQDADSEESEPKVKKTRVRKAAAKKLTNEKGPAKPRARKKAVKVPPRMFARWAVCDGAFKRVALFDYKDRDGADAKLIQLREDKKGPFFLQLVKDAYEPPVVETAAVAV